MKKVNEQNKQNPNNLTMSKCQSIVIYWVKPLLVMPASHAETSLRSGCPTLDPTPCCAPGEATEDG